MDLNEVSIFLKVVEHGSFSKAAKQLNMPNSTVSTKVSSLEERLGVTLIQRTTRKLHITPSGAEFYKKCLAGVEAIAAAESEVSSVKGEPQGLLRITAPADLGPNILSYLISVYTNKYPKTCVETILTDRTVDLLGEGVDLAIRAGNLKDSTLMAKKIGSVYFAPFASAKYVKNFGTPVHPKELLHHRTLHFKPMEAGVWQFIGPKGAVSASVKPHVISNQLDMIKEMALNGEGIAYLPTYFCFNEFKSGKLVRLLPEWRSSLTPIHFVWPSQKFIAPKLSQFIQLATDVIKKNFDNFEI